MATRLEVEARIVSLGARGRSAGQISDAVKLPLAPVAALLKDHGYPDMGKLARASQVLADRLLNVARGGSDVGGGDAPPAALPDAWQRLLDDAQQVPRLRRRAVDLASRLAELRRELAVEAIAEAARVEQARELADLEAKAKALEAKAKQIRTEIATRSGKKTSRQTVSTLTTSERAACRAWALEAGLPCHRTGIIPAATVTAWRDAQANVAA